MHREILAIVWLAIFWPTTIQAAPQVESSSAASSAQDFRIVALGDTTYNLPADGEAYSSLVNMINARSPSFTIHVGDTKGAGSCDDEFQHRIRDGFARFEGPVFYTPGDNEWTDCHKPVNGGSDPVDRLAAIRTIFFSDGDSQGARTLPTEQQSTAFPENRMWVQSNVLFVTVHIVGSNNGYDNLAEFEARETAGIEWIEQAFSTAETRGYDAIVFAFQAEIFANPAAEGFRRTHVAFRERSIGTNLPVLFIHGDAHTFKFDRPFYRSASDGSVYEGANVFRLQTFGAPEVAAVEVSVRSGSPAPFSIQPIFPNP